MRNYIVGFSSFRRGLPISSLYMCRNVFSTWDSSGRGKCEHDTWHIFGGKKLFSVRIGSLLWCHKQSYLSKMKKKFSKEKK